MLNLALNIKNDDQLIFNYLRNYAQKKKTILEIPLFFFFVFKLLINIYNHTREGTVMTFKLENSRSLSKYLYRWFQSDMNVHSLHNIYIYIYISSPWIKNHCSINLHDYNSIFKDQCDLSLLPFNIYWYLLKSIKNSPV